ncbi:hypothetical protein V1512DRAFT_277052 [Lipomyces arxii]|uniref:uncharacterized protein n=1 Tax=Lipomyces arxii TaxID=56418 RepID=UPI0034CEA196
MIESAISVVVTIVSRTCIAIAALLIGPTIVLIVSDLAIYLYRTMSQYIYSNYIRAQYQQKQGVVVYCRKILRHRSAPVKIKIVS